MEKETTEALIASALQGDDQSLEELLMGVSDLLFNLSLRMLGSIADAQDATQELLIRIMTNLAAFRKESTFQTWVYRLATNYLIDYKKSMFAQHPLDFEFYANDIRMGLADPADQLLSDLSREVLAQELKMSCTNVMLQCLDPQTRCIFIVGTMFKLDSRIAGEIFAMTPQNYRKKLSRARKKMAAFLSLHCGLTESGYCDCNKRIEYAVQQHRLHPKHMEYQHLKQLDKSMLSQYKEDMETIDEYALIFEDLPIYQSAVDAKLFIKKLLQTQQFKNIQSFEEDFV